MKNKEKKIWIAPQISLLDGSETTSGTITTGAEATTFVSGAPVGS
ncbi:MAG: hypothetical protein ACI85I_002560 [Arenicella sp.]|jgi:hypothetical protein